MDDPSTFLAEWLRGEREADEQLARGEGTKYDSLEAFLRDLD